MDSKLKSFAISLLRRGTFRWKPRNEVRKAAKIEYGKYICQICLKITRAKDLIIDHRLPVVDPEVGWQGFDVYIERMFCPAENLQAICKPCHLVKTASEAVIRKEAKDKLKALNPLVTKKKALTNKKKSRKVKSGA